MNKAAIHFFEVEYTAESSLPHSKQHDVDLEVISPQFGHILCDPYPATCGIGLRIQWTSKIMKTMIFRLKETIVVFTKMTLLGRVLHNGLGRRLLSAKPKVWEYFRWTGLGQKT